MTTTVTVETHDWPVKLTTRDEMRTGVTETWETVPPHSKRQVYLSDTRSIRFEELPKPDQVA